MDPSTSQPWLLKADSQPCKRPRLGFCSPGSEPVSGCSSVGQAQRFQAADAFTLASLCDLWLTCTAGPAEAPAATAATATSSSGGWDLQQQALLEQELDRLATCWRAQEQARPTTMDALMEDAPAPQHHQHKHNSCSSSGAATAVGGCSSWPEPCQAAGAFRAASDGQPQHLHPRGCEGQQQQQVERASLMRATARTTSDVSMQVMNCGPATDLAACASASLLEQQGALEEDFGWFHRCRGCGQMTSQESDVGDGTVMPLCRSCFTVLRRKPEACREDLICRLVKVNATWKEANM